MIAQVSIVLPTYNGEKYIAQSIESIIAQTFQDWELIIVDDCSTDNTLNIIQKYAKQDKRIRVLRNEENQKLPQSLNIGFAEAKGSYLTWTSDDNFYLPEAIETMYEYLNGASGLYMVCADMNIVDEEGFVLRQSEPYEDNRIGLRNCVGACFLYRREVLSLIGGYDAEMLYVEDYDYWLRIRMNCGRIERIDKILYHYRWHEGSLSATKKQQVSLRLSMLREKYIDFILESLIYDKRMLTYIYYEMKQSGYAEMQIIQKFLQQVPELVPLEEKREAFNECIIFGAGGCGYKAYTEHGDKVKCFVDNNQEIVGNLKCGVPIISFRELRHLDGRTPIIIAVSKEKAFDIIYQLYSNGIRDYRLYFEKNM